MYAKFMPFLAASRAVGRLLKDADLARWDAQKRLKDVILHPRVLKDVILHPRDLSLNPYPTQVSHVILGQSWFS